jgi:hypothetical protein
MMPRRIPKMLKETINDECGMMKGKQFSVFSFQFPVEES